MEAIVERCCGLDVHKDTVVACLLVGEADKKPRQQMRTFGTLRCELEELRKWLLQEGCTHVAMESTGVYWMPIYLTLEDSGMQLVVGNASHIKAVPGRKTDVKDSQWLADLLRHGLIASSFVPPEPIRELRDLTRYRRKLVESQTAERNRLLKLLETANIKLASVASDVFGVSGMLMVRALVDGKATPQEMASLAKGALRKKLEPLAQALDGRVNEHHRFLLGIQLRRLDEVQAEIAMLDERIEARLEPFRKQHERLMQIPGVDRIGAAVLIAELGVDMSVFPTAGHACAWAGVCPGNHESAGRRKRQGRRKGNVHLTTALVQAAMCASKQKGTYLKDKYWRLKQHCGQKRAAVAVGRKILIAAYHMLANDKDYVDLGGSYLSKLSEARLKAISVRHLQRMGFDVHLEKRAA